MFSFLKKKAHNGTQVGIDINADGIGIARISAVSPSSPPQLILCRYLHTDDEAQRGHLLQQLSEQYQLEHSPCISVAENSSFTLLLVEAPKVDHSELKAAVRWRIKDLLDFHIDDAVIDVFDIPGQQERGRPKLMYVVASRISTIRSHIDLLETHDINLTAIDIPELALRNIATLLPEDKSGVAMLHLSRRSGLLTVTHDKNLYLARRLELGTHQLEETLQAVHERDEFVLEGVDEMPVPLQRALDTIVMEVQRSLDYYESHFSLPQVSGLVIVPTARPIPGMMGYIAGHLGLPVRMLDLNVLLDCRQSLSDEMQSQCLLAIGAALRQENKAL